MSVKMLQNENVGSKSYLKTNTLSFIQTISQYKNQIYVDKNTDFYIYIFKSSMNFEIHIN